MMIHENLYYGGFNKNIDDVNNYGSYTKRPSSPLLLKKVILRAIGIFSTIQWQQN